MSKPKRESTVPPVGAIDWTGVRAQRVEYLPGATIFAQGDPATSVMYVENGTVRIAVVSHAGKEAVIAGDPGRDGRHDTVAGQLFHEQVSEARVHRVQRRFED